MWAFILPELLKAIEAEPENEVLAELLASLARCHICSSRSFKVTPTAPMGGGTQPFEGAHLTGAIRAFNPDQANVAIMDIFVVVKSSNVPPENIKTRLKESSVPPLNNDFESNVPQHKHSLIGYIDNSVCQELAFQVH